MSQSLTRVEALFWALANLNGALYPTSRAFRNRNPLLLKCFKSTHERDKDGFRIFRSFNAGVDNGIVDLEIKCSGKSNANIKETSTLRDLVRFFGNDASATRSVKNYLRHALNDDSIRETQELKWFIEDNPKHQVAQSTEEINA